MELPRLEPLYRKYGDRGLSIVAVEGTGDREGALKFIQENGLTYTFLENGQDDAEVVRKVFRISGYPTSYLVDRQGKILYHHLGFEEGDEQQLEQEILTLLGG